MSIWQTKKWGEMLVKSNQATKIIELNGFFIEKRRVSLGEFGLFVLGIENQISEKDVNQMIKICKKENALFLQIETLDYREKNIGIDLKNGYYKKFITPFTSVVDLKKSEEEILALMKPKGRSNIKKAIKKGVVVEMVEKTDENAKIFYDLMNETTSRKGFSGNNLDFYKTFLDKLDNSTLLFAKIDGKVIAAGIFIFDKKVSIYYYGASTGDRNEKKLMAPELLQWEAIKIAKSKGSKIYDFLGVATPGDEKSSLIGVTNFKKKLSNDIREVSKSFIYINKKFKYLLINLLRKFK